VVAKYLSHPVVIQGKPRAVGKAQLCDAATDFDLRKLVASEPLAWLDRGACHAADTIASNHAVPDVRPRVSQPITLVLRRSYVPPMCLARDRWPHPDSRKLRRRLRRRTERSTW
jgi:hypothetical protein